MDVRNQNFRSLQKNYLFVDIADRKKQFLEKNPQVELINLGIGDTTHPIPSSILKGFLEKVEDLGCEERYTGYPEYNGSAKLRNLIASVMYNDLVSPDEIFISDGSKPDLGRLQFLFSRHTKFAVQDPVYPAYVDALVIGGKAGEFDKSSSRYSNIKYLECNPQNNFFPNLDCLEDVDCVYFCSPNNPTGIASTRNQLTKLINYAVERKKIIIFDSAYRGFIRDPNIPNNIYEIENAKKVVFETSSFSKLAGFTGVRLGWTVCPKDLVFADGTMLWEDWSRIAGTLFNGPSNIAETGGCAALLERNQAGIKLLTDYYLENSLILKKALISIGVEVHGGENSPYLWVKLSKDQDSWGCFQHFLEKLHIITTPGSGFGKGGEGFLRFSCFAPRGDIIKACEKIIRFFKDSKIQ